MKIADLLVLNKPAGLVVHPAPGNADGTLVNALLAHCGDSLPGIGGERRPGIVHRLDRDTSGVMVVAKTETSLAALSAMFAARDLERAYVALVWGVPNQAAGEIEGAIGRDPRDRKRMAILACGGRAALTHYRTQRVFGGQREPAGITAGEPGARTRSGCIWPAAAIPWWAIRSICGVFPRSAGGCRRTCGGCCWISRGRRCMRGAWASGTREPRCRCTLKANRRPIFVIWWRCWNVPELREAVCITPERRKICHKFNVL